MTKILSIVNFDDDVLFNLIDGTTSCVFTGESGRRPLKSTQGLITRTFNFRITAASKALARTAVNTFIASLRQAVEWNEDNLDAVSVFLKEGADGETAVRSLIVNWDASADVDGSAIDGYQTTNTELFVSVALTLQDHREESTKTEVTLTSITTAASSIGRKLEITDANNTADSRILLSMNGAGGTGVTHDKVWIGITQHKGDDFQHIWDLDNGTVLNGSSKVTALTDSQSTQLIKVENADFSTTTMLPRVRIVNYQQYNAAGSSNYLHGIGEFVALLRYQIDGTGTILSRLGVSYSTGGDVAYNEQRLLEGDGDFRFAQMGILKLPPRGRRAEIITGGYYNWDTLGLTVWIDAQRLSGTAELYLDSITLIPYDHFISLENTSMSSSGEDCVIITNEDLTIESFTKPSVGIYLESYVTISEQRNFMLPQIEGTKLQLVIASEGSAVQSKTSNLDIDDFNIYEAFEAYNV